MQQLFPTEMQVTVIINVTLLVVKISIFAISRREQYEKAIFRNAISAMGILNTAPFNMFQTRQPVKTHDWLLQYSSPRLENQCTNPGCLN